MFILTQLPPVFSMCKNRSRPHGGGVMRLRSHRREAKVAGGDGGGGSKGGMFVFVRTFFRKLFPKHTEANRAAGIGILQQLHL